MKTQHDYFLIFDYGFYDSCVGAAVRPLLIHMYSTIKRFAWRGESDDPKHIWLKKKGLIGARINQTKLAAMLGLKRNAVNRMIAELKELGWIKTVGDPKNPANVTYILGEVATGQITGVTGEAFYADNWMLKLWSRLEALAKNDGVEVSQLDVELRVMTAQNFVEETIKKHTAKPDSDVGLIDS